MLQLRSFSLLTILLFILGFQASAQQNYEIACVGFYNLENLFDTEDDPKIWDEEFTPSGNKVWTEEKYQEKLSNMADVIAQLGKSRTKKGVVLLGVSEIENKKVLEDLVIQDKLKNRDYGIVHYDSPDRRGIDVALLYQKSMFTVDTSYALPLLIHQPDGSRIFTRDILVVKGELDNDPIYVMVNHWPSRRGGEARSSPLREAAARNCRAFVDSITTNDPNAKILIMGDLNDDPTSKSLKKILKSKGKKKEIKKSNDLYNTMYTLYKKGIGSNAYRDNWSLFDQIILSKNLTTKTDTGYFHYQTEVFNKDFLIQKTGRYKGYPFRTFSGGTYIGGYSDHFPALVYLVKEVSSP